MDRRKLIVVATCACLLAAGAFAQNKPTPGPFDGKYTGESARCSPASNNYRFNGLVVTNNGGSWQAQDGGRTSTCRYTINRDGSFSTPADCPFQVSGQFEGKKATIRIKTSERECNVIARRD
jgi:hypothetical protein